MAHLPQFPHFKPIGIEDRDIIQRILWMYQPQTSELTFTNLFIWRSHYGVEWSLYRDWLLVLCTSNTDGPYALQPTGGPHRLEVVRMLLHWLRDERGVRQPRIDRAAQRLISEIEDAEDLFVEPVRDHFDYVYRSEDLIRLVGRKYHSRRNHINTFLKAYTFNYDSLDEEHVEACLDVAANWCERRRCEDDMSLMDEWEAVRQALIHFTSLKIQGGAIFVEGKVEAFTLGELLNDETAVVHIEKANPDIRGLYAVINQQFCEKSWQKVPHVNREQDLGVRGLRQAKLAYHPERLIEKFQIRLDGT